MRVAQRRPRGLVKRTMAAAVEEALVTFHGRRKCEVPPGASCDELLWAAICWRIGSANFIEAIYICSQDMGRLGKPLCGRAAARYFQSYLNRHFPKPLSNYNSKPELTPGGAR